MDENGNAIKAALLQRDALMTLLLAQSHELIQQLALLSGAEKNAVIGLAAIGHVAGAYAHAPQPDPELVAGFQRALASLSPAASRRLVLPLTPSGEYLFADVTKMNRQIRDLLAALAPRVESEERSAEGVRSLPLNR